MLLTALTYIGVAIGGYVIGHFGLPAIAAFFKNVSATHAVTAAQKLVAAEEAKVKALANAKAIIAAHPPAPPATPAPKAP